MKNISDIMNIINTERNHMKIKILEEFQIIRAAKSADKLNDVINGKNKLSTDYYHNS